MPLISKGLVAGADAAKTSEPATDNPMLSYLRERSKEIAIEDGIDTAVAWVARNAWFEGAIAERARIARLVDED